METLKISRNKIYSFFSVSFVVKRLLLFVAASLFIGISLPVSSEWVWCGDCHGMPDEYRNSCVYFIGDYNTDPILDDLRCGGLPPPPPSCTITIFQLEDKAVSVLRSIPKEPQERFFTFECERSGDIAYVEAYHTNSSFDDDNSQDPCAVTPPSNIGNAIAIGHSHPYFTSVEEMNSGIGCNGPALSR